MIVVLGIPLALVLLIPALTGAIGGSCRDTLALSGPVAAFDASADTATGAATVRYTEGERLTPDWTEALYLHVTTADGGDSTRYLLTDMSTGDALPPGDEFTVEGVTVSGRPLEAGDTLRVVRRGTERPREHRLGGDPRTNRRRVARLVLGVRPPETGWL